MVFYFEIGCYPNSIQIGFVLIGLLASFINVDGYFSFQFGLTKLDFNLSY
jgi:hypothetical protein